MGGLVLLGLATVSAGILSGRVVLEQALETYAVQAANDWTRQIESGADEATGADRAAGAPEDAGSASNPTVRGAPGEARDAPRSLDGPEPDAEQAAGRVMEFALLDARMVPISRSAEFSDGELREIMGASDFGTVFDQAVLTRRARLLNGDGLLPGKHQADHRFYVVVPIVEEGRVGRVYVVRLDQSAAFQMTKDALTRASLVTTLLMVLGFVVPAAVASRRIRERRAAEEKLRFLALHDPLTGLANRTQLRERLDQAVARARRHGHTMAVYCLDLDRFKDVNDTLGHPAGDALLEEVAARLRRSVREIDTVARLGGDEFAVVTEQVASPDAAAALASRICEILSEPITVGGHAVTTSASIGIAFGPLGKGEADSLLSHADIALYRAKREGRNGYCFFEAQMHAALQDERQLQQDLRRALKGGELQLHYQPQFDLESGRITGYEALVRWCHPARGEISPDVFVPIAEQGGLIAELSEWVLRTACSYARTWPADVKLAVNLSPVQFKRQDVVSFVGGILEETGFPAHRLEAEITEGVFLVNSETVIAQLRQLDRLGVSIAMDDFGTGYSSLSYLTRMPVKKIKIDQSFVSSLDSDEQKKAVVSTIVGLGHSLGVTIIAEGVETAHQLDYLRACGCDEVQGYYCGKPEPEIVPQEVVPKPFLVVSNACRRAAAL